jgi:hypothetical protein
MARQRAGAGAFLYNGTQRQLHPNPSDLLDLKKDELS